LKDEFCVQISPLGHIVDRVGIDQIPGIFRWIAQIVWNCVDQFASASFAIVKMLSRFS
jgi:hypothetical protein